MKIEREELNPGVWFDLPDDEDGARVCLRLCTADELRKIRKQTTKKQTYWRRGVRYQEDITDEEQQSRLIWDYCIMDWENIFMDGEPLECNTDNKYLLMAHVPSFGDKVGRFVNALSDDVILEAKDLEKN